MRPADTGAWISTVVPTDAGILKGATKLEASEFLAALISGCESWEETWDCRPAGCVMTADSASGAPTDSYAISAASITAVCFRKILLFSPRMEVGDVRPMFAFPWKKLALIQGKCYPGHLNVTLTFGNFCVTP